MDQFVQILLEKVLKEIREAVEQREHGNTHGVYKVMLAKNCRDSL